jgi:ADP-dependent NAD(P)H-hydrate dehydratase / NAD(P)H-hydrate epimerase
VVAVKIQFLMLEQTGHDLNAGFTLHLDGDRNISRPTLALPAQATHKYSRGHAMVMSGPKLYTGASRLVAQAALAVGAGLVTIFGDKDALNEQAAHVTAIMLQEHDGNFDFIDNRVQALAVGPGAGVSAGLADDVLALLSIKLPIVLDADALTCFAGKPDVLFASLHHRAVLTPHEGEFLRLFPDLLLADRLNAVRAAAMRAGSVVLLKGPQTIVAAPDGRLALNGHASPWLATAGSGDVLTGIICGLLAQNQDAFEAAAIGVWLHGDIGVRFGPGLTADKMTDLIPEVLRGCLINA